MEHKLGLPGPIAHDLVERFRFLEQLFVTFYSANSIMKLRYWHDGLSIERASKLYTRMTAKYMGISYPGEYWLLHHIMPDFHLYGPSYLLAQVRAHELRDALVSTFGRRYWQEKGAGRFLLDLMRPGRSIELGRFSKLDSESYVKFLKALA